MRCCRCRDSLLSSGRSYRRDSHKSEKGYAFYSRDFTCSYHWAVYFTLLGAGRRFSIRLHGHWRTCFFHSTMSKRNLVHCMCQHVQINVIKATKGEHQSMRVPNAHMYRRSVVLSVKCASETERRDPTNVDDAPSSFTPYCKTQQHSF